MTNRLCCRLGICRHQNHARRQLTHSALITSEMRRVVWGFSAEKHARIMVLPLLLKSFPRRVWKQKYQVCRVAHVTAMFTLSRILIGIVVRSFLTIGSPKKSRITSKRTQANNYLISWLLSDAYMQSLKTGSWFLTLLPSLMWISPFHFSSNVHALCSLLATPLSSLLRISRKSCQRITMVSTYIQDCACDGTTLSQYFEHSLFHIACARSFNSLI